MFTSLTVDLKLYYYFSSYGYIIVFLIIFSPLTFVWVYIVLTPLNKLPVPNILNVDSLFNSSEFIYMLVTNSILALG